MDCTYVLGFWEVPNNAKHNMSHYYKYIPLTFNTLIGKKIIFFYEDLEILNYIRKIINTRYFIPIHLRLQDLPTYYLSNNLLHSCKRMDIQQIITSNKEKNIHDSHKREKGIVHYEREFLKSGEESYRKIISIWTSKIFLLERVILENPFITEDFAWLDVSISRMGKDYVNCNFIKHMFNSNNSHPWPPMLYLGEEINNSAGFMISNKHTWDTIIPLYKNTLDRIKDSDYAHDEETILHLVYKKHSNLFNII